MKMLVRQHSIYLSDKTSSRKPFRSQIRGYYPGKEELMVYNTFYIIEYHHLTQIIKNSW